MDSILQYLELLNYSELIIVISVGIVSGFVNIMAGGGSNITLPALIILGLDSTVANGTNRLGLLFQNLISTLVFNKKKALNCREGIFLSFPFIFGAFLGSILAININDEFFNYLLVSIMLITVFTILFPVKKKILSVINNIAEIKNAKFFIMFLVGIYGGLIQIGTAFLIIIILYKFFNKNIKQANIQKVFIIFLYTIPVFIVFLLSGNINWEIGLSLALGNIIGAYISSKLLLKLNEIYIKYIIGVVIFIMSLKLLFM